MIRKVAVIVFGRSAAKAAQFFVFVIISHFLSSSEFGWYGIITTSIVLASTLGSLGLRQSIAYSIGKNIFSSKAGLNFSIKAIPILAFFPTIASLIFINEVSGYEYLSFFIILYTAIVGAMAVMIFQGMLLGLGKTSYFSIADSLYPIISLSLVVILFFIEAITFESIMISLSASYFIAGLVAALITALISYSSKEDYSTCPSEKLDVIQIKNLLFHGFYYALNIFLITMSSRLSFIMVSYLLSSSEAGQYFAGQRLGEIFIEMATAIGLVLFSDTVRSSDPRRSLEKNIRISALILWTFMLVAIFVSVFSPWIVFLIFGDRFASAALVLSVTAFAIAPAAATKIIYPSIAAHGKPLWGTSSIVVSLLFGIIFSLILIPKFGIVGAAFSSLISQSTLFLGYVLILRIGFKVSPRNVLLPSFFKRNT